VLLLKLSVVCVVVQLTPTIGYCCRQVIHCCVSPQPLLNKDIKVKDNKQKPNDACPAETEADREPQPKITTSCLQQYLYWL